MSGPWGEKGGGDCDGWVRLDDFDREGREIVDRVVDSTDVLNACGFGIVHKSRSYFTKHHLG